MASAQFKLSPQTCPNCRYSFNLLGVRMNQEVNCFKCGKIFEAYIKLEVDKTTEETSSNEPERRTAIFWLLMITFTLFCLERAVTTSTEAITTPLEPVITSAENATTPQEPVATPEEPVMVTEVVNTTPEEPITTIAETATTPEEPVVIAEEPIATPEEPVTTAAETPTTPEESAPINFLLSQADSNFKAKEYSEAINNYEAYLKKTSTLTAGAKLEIYWKLAQSEEKAGNKETAIIWNEIILKEFENIRDWKIHSARSALKRLAASQI